MTRLINKVALVTGGNSGIGLTVAQRFAQEGASVVVVARRAAELEKTLQSLGDKAIAISADLTLAEDRERVFKDIEKRHGRLDILVANAGRSDFLPLQDITEDHYDAIFALNTKATLFTAQAALRLMREGGSIVLVASVAHLTGAPGLGVYAASKAALRSFARTWTSELADRGIRVNVISPGPIQTPAFDAVPEAMTNALVAQVPLKRLGRTDEVAAAALFLGSDESSYVTGIDLCVDGGMAQV